MPSPNATADICAVPCSTMLNDVESSPELTSCAVSAERFEAPLAESAAPPVPIESSQPRPGNPAFPHGHGDGCASPEQKTLVPQPCHSATKSDGTPPAALNPPPAYRSASASAPSSNTASA